MSYPDFNEDFVLDTDASSHGIEAVLCQGGKPIAYASRKELLHIVEFVKHFRHYVQGPKFLVRADHAPQRSVLKEPEGQLARWIEFLRTVHYEMSIAREKKHLNAVAMSERPCTQRCR